MEIRPFQQQDSAYFNIPQFPSNVTAWVMCDSSQRPVGFIGYGPLPGLPGLADLYIFVLPSFRRQRIGTRLFDHLIRHLHLSDITQIATPTESDANALTHFMLHQGSFVGHQEITYTKHNIFDLPPQSVLLHSADIVHSAPILRTLYDQSFAGHPWYQPYSNDLEVINDFAGNCEILFLHEKDEPIGFAGIAYLEENVADFEPVGMIPAYQRQGFGRKLLIAALHHAKRHGAASAQITTWSTNQAARALYHSLGFEPVSTRNYLTYDIVPVRNA